MNMKKSILRNSVIAALGSLAFSTAQADITWTLSPDAAAGDAFGTTVIAGSNAINFLDNGLQTPGIYGAGFTWDTASGFTLKFDHDLYTWDSYNALGTNGSAGGDGYYDAFVVTISSTGFYWNSSPSDPVLNSASTWVWGGTSWNDGVKENNVCNVGCLETISLAGGPQTVYVSVVLDTATSPQTDNQHPSYGSFHVTPVPEPEIYAMLAAGLGLMGFVARRRKQQT